MLGCYGRYGAALGGLIAILLLGGAGEPQGALKGAGGASEKQGAERQAAPTQTQPQTPPALPAPKQERVGGSQKAAPETPQEASRKPSFLLDPLGWVGAWILDPDNFSDFLMVLFTLALTVVAFKQHFLESKLAQDTADALSVAKQSADAAAKGATAAISAARATRRLVGATTAAAQAASAHVRIAEETAEIQLRPYLHITRDKDDPQVLNRTSLITFRLKNYGQTPARNVVLRRGDLSTIRPVGDAVVEFTDGEVAMGTVPPGGHADFYLSMADLDAGIYDLIEEDLWVLLIRLWVRYDYAPGKMDEDDIVAMVTSDSLSTGGTPILSPYERNKPPSREPGTPPKNWKPPTQDA